MGFRSLHSPVALVVLLVPLAVASGRSSRAEAPAGEARLADRVVAIVDEEPILLSDLERAIALGYVETVPGEGEAALHRRALDALIEWRIRLHEIARFGFEQAPLDEVERQLERLRARHPSETAWRAELARLDLDEGEVRQLLARQLAVLAYVEQRLGPRVFVGADEIQSHYDEDLVPRLVAGGEPVPPIEEVREAIRGVLRERKLNAEIDRWTAELRRAADVVDLLEPEPHPLPPPVAVFEAGPPA
jgi:hypothetical protein